MGKNQHVVRRGKQWVVRGAGNKKDTSVHETQKDAIDSAIDIAKNQGSEVIVHGRDGRIRSKDSYGNDPCSPKDKEH